MTGLPDLPDGKHKMLLVAVLVLASNRRASWKKLLIRALIGAVIANLLGSPMDEARNWARRQWTHGRQLLVRTETPPRPGE
jgi:hypothetical protein